MGAEGPGITLGDHQYTETEEQPSPDTGTLFEPQLNPTLERRQAGGRQCITPARAPAGDLQAFLVCTETSKQLPCEAATR